jgi:hypothetical protein
MQKFLTWCWDTLTLWNGMLMIASLGLSLLFGPAMIYAGVRGLVEFDHTCIVSFVFIALGAILTSNTIFVINLK